MATCTGDQYVQNIERTECIGNSLVKINNNFAALDVAVCETGNSIAEINESLQNHESQLEDVQTLVASTAAFVPVNFATRSNANVVLANKHFIGNTSLDPWWSGVQTETVPTPPAGCVGIQAKIYFNSNATQNNALSFFLRKDSTENWGAPAGTTAQTITQAQYDAINTDYKKIYMDPHSPGYEVDAYITIPIYTSSTNTFQWFVADSKISSTAPASNPTYTITMDFLGYYLAAS